MRQLDERNSYFDRLFNTPDLIWLGQNTNHFPTHPAVAQAMHDCIDSGEYHLYAPPAGMEELRQLILSDIGLPEATVLVTDGAIEGLYHTCHTLCGAGDTFITTDPGWKWPVAFSKAAGADIVELPIYGREQDYRLQPAQLEAAITDRTRLVYLVDPINPLGGCYSASEIEAIAAIAKGAGAYLIHDCTYRHFADAHSLAARAYPEGTVTTYSFSKWLGLAGLRIGAIIGDGELIEKLASAPPNNLGSNVLSQRAAIAGLRTKADWFPEVQRRQRANQAMIRDAVQGIEGLEAPIYPSNGNFMIIDMTVSGVSPDALCDVLRGDKVLIRQGRYHSDQFADRFVKISTSVPEEWVARLCELLPDAVARARGTNTVIRAF